MSRFYALILFLAASSLFVNAQHHRSDRIEQTDRFGFTAMSYFNYAGWTGDKNKSSLKFDSFRIWAQTDVSDVIFAGVQYRFYEGWRTPTQMYIGWNINEKNTLKTGQIWVPFGFGYQPYDDWGNILYYTGFQDDYDYGISWTGTYGDLAVHAAWFLNQQLSSSSPQRIDTDIFSGDAGPDNLFEYTKRNQEKQQLNIMLEYTPSWENLSLTAGISGMLGGLYNQDTDKYGSRYAGAVHFGLDAGNFHFNLQETYYKYTQELPDTATQDMKDFLNVASWNFGYEMPVEANIFATSTAYDFIGEKLTGYLNYSILSGGTSQASSHFLSAGVSTIWRLFQIYGEIHYGINDPQLSGNASGYGRNADVNDFGFQIRVYYTMSVLKQSTIDRIKGK